jgi:hypothetical protein
MPQPERDRWFESVFLHRRVCELSRLLGWGRGFFELMRMRAQAAELRRKLANRNPLKPYEPRPHGMARREEQSELNRGAPILSGQQS